MVTPYFHFFLWRSRQRADAEEFAQALDLLFQLIKPRSEMASNSGGGGDLAAVIMLASGSRQVFLLKAH